MNRNFNSLKFPVPPYKFSKKPKNFFIISKKYLENLLNWMFFKNPKKR